MDRRLAFSKSHHAGRIERTISKADPNCLHVCVLRSFVRRVSRRPEGEDIIRDAAALQRTMNRLRGGGLIPRGVYRFASHEDADEWMIRTIADTHAHLSIERTVS
jgi:hypothetical protein